MIEFSLSKLNMLIFVTAVAAIVIFFIGAVNSNMKTRQSYELVYKIGKELKTGTESNSYCTVKFMDIPKTIQTNSGNSDAFNIKYKLNVSSFPEQGKLVLAVVDRKVNKPRIYAAYDIDYNGDVKIFESDICDNYPVCEINPAENNSTYFDPSKAYSIDSTILFAKTINQGQPVIYLIPCVRKNGIYSCRNFLRTDDSLGTNITPKEAIPCLSAIYDLVDDETERGQ